MRWCSSLRGWWSLKDVCEITSSYAVKQSAKSSCPSPSVIYVFEDSCLLRCDIEQCDTSLPTFREIVVPSMRKRKPNSKFSTVRIKAVCFSEASVKFCRLTLLHSPDNGKIFRWRRNTHSQDYLRLHGWNLGAWSWPLTSIQHRNKKKKWSYTSISPYVFMV
jgi:hypothetical protein